MPESPARLVDQFGMPMVSSPRAALPANAALRAARALAYAGGYRGGAGAYDAASLTSQDLAGWQPRLGSPDSEVAGDRDRMVARTRDLVRNDGWAHGAITRPLDNTIGSVFRLVARPDYLALRSVSPAFDARWAEEFAAAAEAEWRMWADDPGRWCDARRRSTMVQLFRLALRHKLVDGDNFAVLTWDEDQVASGVSRYATTVHMIEPDRVCNPGEGPDTEFLRNGIEIDARGAAVAYHVRRAYPNDWYGAAGAMTWDRVARETPWGRPIVVHDCDADRHEQSRGVSILAPVLGRMRLLGQYDHAELKQALLKTVINTFVTSPYDAADIRNALEIGDGQNDPELSYYQQLRRDWSSNRPAMIGDVRLPTLAPGETIQSLPPGAPSANFDLFEHAMLRNVAAGTGQSAEQVSLDYSKANYSSIRASLLDMWKTLQRRRQDFATGTATPIYGAFLEEAIDRGRVPLPRQAPPFMQWRAAYMRCRWIGPGRGWIDPVKERQGAVMGMEAGFDTMQDVCAESSGADWREQLDQRAIEVEAFRARGLTPPAWSGMDMRGTSDAEREGVPA